jgi:hypothetical protein
MQHDPAGPQLEYATYVGPYRPARPKGMAVASLVLGICGLALCLVSVCLTPVCSTLAVIFGILARNAARRGEADGEGMALAGLILGVIGLALTALMLLVFLAAGLAGAF